MAKPILLKKSTIPGRVPGTEDLEVGELALNTADRLLFSRHSDGTVFTVGVTASAVEAALGYMPADGAAIGQIAALLEAI
ncbi:hypothetical protein [Chlorobium sp. N1]|uniref:hypothetical protein n=1 Tax=Chlorobium sp. N1 TaxID=2491138 RepID=UPI0010404F0E|nr:hypothetical protein [Chlorobium sp. N1]TCD47017.1 hypothetical protein E0L29_10305 [Chlorobium sp. N1]